MRHLNFTDEGVAVDLDTMFTPEGHFPAPRPEAITLGDTHVRFTDASVDAATFGKRGLVPMLKPKRIYWEDVCDGYSANPHHEGNPFNAQAKALSGFDDVQAETFESIDFVADRTPDDAISYLVPDNHGDFLRRWIIRNDWRKDVPPIARSFYLETAKAMHDGTRMGSGGTETPSPFVYWVGQRCKKPNVICLSGDGGEGSRVLGVQMDMHGHLGPNGARGSIQNLSRIGTKATIAHGHAPGAEGGCHQVGTSSRLRLEYNGGPSGWLHCHSLLHFNGKRQLVIMVEGKWRL
jgi:hypothetical protein